MTILDISTPIRAGMVHWPGDEEIEVARVSAIAEGALCNVTHLKMSAHTGTHMDAPLHFLDGRAAMDALPLDAVCGPCRVIAVDDPVCVRPEHVADARAGERLLFRTRNSQRDWSMQPFDEQFVYISDAAARVMAERGVQTAGVDYLSVGGYSQDLAETHYTLLGAGIWIIEGLALQQVEPGAYELICLPLSIPGADGAPARAILRR